MMGFVENQEILADTNFLKEIGKYGYDRYRLDGDPFGVECRLWKVGDSVASITAQGVTVLHAVNNAVLLCRVVHDGEK